MWTFRSNFVAMSAMETVLFQLLATSLFSTHCEASGDRVGASFTDPAGLRTLYLYFPLVRVVVAMVLELWTGGFFATYCEGCYFLVPTCRGRLAAT